FRYTLPDLRNCDRPQNLRSWDERASVGVQVCENELEGCVEIDLRPTVRDLPSIVEDVGKLKYQVDVLNRQVNRLEQRRAPLGGSTRTTPYLRRSRGGLAAVNKACVQGHIVKIVDAPSLSLSSFTNSSCDGDSL
ncbi:hypothetical protein FOZ62_029469, partial [Perkinsus olseni]